MSTRLTNEHMKLMNIGKRFWGASRKGLSKDQVKIVGEYLDGLGKNLQQGVGLYLWGDNSVGKSYVGTVLCKVSWGIHQIPSFCVTAAELKEAWIEDRALFLESRETVCGRASRIQFLVIDDLGREHRASTGFAENKFGALLRQRSRDKKTTVITTNLTPEKFMLTYGKASYELVRESMLIEEMRGKNHRVSVANKDLVSFG